MVQYIEIMGERLAWQSENQAKVPKRIEIVDDTLSTEQALRLVRNGTALLWQGDFIQAKQLLAAMGRRIELGKNSRAKKSKLSASLPSPTHFLNSDSQSSAKSFHLYLNSDSQSRAKSFHLYRLAQSQKAQLLGMLLIRVEANFTIHLRRAPDIQEAAAQVWSWQEPFVVSLRELLGVIGAYEWRKNGVPIPCLGKAAKIYPFYGVFSPIRGEYLDLVAEAPLPDKHHTAIEVGCGTGVLSAILAKRGVSQVIATDISSRAVECAKFNMQQLGLEKQVTVLAQPFFPNTLADVIICNPPWLPAKATTSLESAVYDPQSGMLKGFLSGVAKHLNDGGEAWLIISNLAEILGLRSREELLTWIQQTGLQVKARYDTTPKHKKVQDKTDPLSQARQQEVTSLWVLKHMPSISDN